MSMKVDVSENDREIVIASRGLKKKKKDELIDDQEEIFESTLCRPTQRIIRF